jgi:hypothetical protein
MTLKKTWTAFACDVASAGVCIGLGLYAVGFNYYMDSLGKNSFASIVGSIGLIVYVLFSLLSVPIVLIHLIRMALSLGQVKGFIEAIRCFLIVVLAAAIFMPQYTSRDTAMYRKKARSVVSPELRQFNDSPKAKELGGPFQIDDYSIEVHHLYNQKSNLVEVRYELKRKIESDSFPGRFSVILNREDGSAELRKEIPK